MQIKTEREYRVIVQMRLRQWRQNSGFRQTEIAKLLRVDPMRYRQWETRAGSIIPLFYVDGFCTATRCRVDDLLSCTARDEERVHLAARQAIGGRKAPS